MAPDRQVRTGRMALRCSRMPRVIAWRIHQVAYVENLKPLRSRDVLHVIRPRFLQIQVESGGPTPVFLAIEPPNRRFD